MARRPVLSEYPHLRNILRNDPIANQQFNAAISSVNGSLPSSGEDVNEKLEKLQRLYLEQSKNYEAVSNQHRKDLRFIRLLGETMEKQTQLRPYSQDLQEQHSYPVTFTPEQVRRLLSIYWNLVAEETEIELSRTLKINDPAADRPETDEEDEDD
jgi:hypothetical protein